MGSATAAAQLGTVRVWWVGQEDPGHPAPTPSVPNICWEGLLAKLTICHFVPFFSNTNGKKKTQKEMGFLIKETSWLHRSPLGLDSNLSS